MKKLFIIGLFLLVLAGCGNTAQTSSNSAQAKPEKKEETTVVKKTKSAVPTLFIHGYSGTENSFGGMLKRLEKSDIAKKEVLMKVSPAGEVTLIGQLSGKKDNPLIQVLFEDNKNNEWSQTEWLYNCLATLKKAGINQVNLVGHSMGGVSGLRYLMTYPNDETQPQILKFVAIGAPFNDFLDASESQSVADLLKNGPNEVSSRYQDYQNLVGNLDQKIQILLLAGQLDQNNFSDGTVPLTSALSVNALLSQTNKVTSKIFYGANAQHSQLHENKAVDQAVANFLWPQ
ncbi:hypothetical protein IGI65_002590 [Enterococcus sp. DIV0755b]|uniref:alpha/beta fold hydrolase n=1 Tax=Enterococcus sp. DIV0755b TaxID=2774657 RepID=UPI003F1EB287